jgi:hypothetical protein
MEEEEEDDDEDDEEGGRGALPPAPLSSTATPIATAQLSPTTPPDDGKPTTPSNITPPLGVPFTITPVDDVEEPVQTVF